jgi:3-hydroxyisobutyrate dehydrogenase-like beta-hydroxyacid dehydrogenase
MHELAAHVRGALTNGCTEEEIREALLQTADYCGVPAALESFRVAQKVIDEHRAAANSTEYKLATFVLPATFASGFTLQLMVEEMRIAAGLATATESPLALGRRSLELWEQAQEALPGSSRSSLSLMVPR